MKCFNHRELDAIATCMRCGRALCPNCLAEVEGITACRLRCETAIEASQKLMQSSQQLMQVSRKQIELQAPVYVGIAYFLYATGIGAWGFAAFMAFTGNFNPPEGLVVGWGLIALVGGGFSHRYAKKLQCKELAP
jgi:hypothetical protein